MRSSRNILSPYPTAVLAILAATCGALVFDAPSNAEVVGRTSDRYVSDLKYRVGVVDQIVLQDPARNQWPVPLLIRYPIGATRPRPLVIWNHGGLPSVNGRTRSDDWGRELAAAGYVVIHPSRVPVDDVTPFLAECAREGFVVPEECALFIAQVKFGPITTVFVMDSLSEIERRVPELAGKLDASKVIVAGHSAGSAIPLVLAGAVRQHAGAVHRDRDDRPIAFIATGPHGADYGSFEDGFREDSFNEIDSRPFLWITGRGDETGQVGAANHEPSETRAAGWLTSTRGNKYLSWDNDPVAVHESMDIDKCEQSPVQQAHCAAFAMLGVAFLDAVVRRRPQAIAYLASSAYETLSGGVIELHRR